MYIHVFIWTGLSVFLFVYLYFKMACLNKNSTGYYSASSLERHPVSSERYGYRMMNIINSSSCIFEVQGKERYQYSYKNQKYVNSTKLVTKNMDEKKVKNGSREVRHLNLQFILNTVDNNIEKGENRKLNIH